MAEASTHLESLYADLDECVAHIMRSLGRYSWCRTLIPSLCKCFLWERFETLAPTPIKYFVAVPDWAGVVVRQEGRASIRLVHYDGQA